MFLTCENEPENCINARKNNTTFYGSAMTCDNLSKNVLMNATINQITVF